MSNNPHDALFLLLQLLARGSAGIKLWREIRVHACTFEHLTAIAGRMAASMGAARRIEGAEVVSHLFLALDRRFERAASERRGNKVFSSKYDGRPINKYLFGLLIRETRRALIYLLRRSRQTTEALSDSLAVESRLEAVMLMDAINSLPKGQRFMIVRHYFEGDTVAEAGAKIGLTRTAAYEKMASARQELRRLLGGNDIER